MTMPREYHRKYSKDYYHKRKNELIIMLGGKCSDCGSSIGLQFDHIDPKGTNIRIGKLLSYSKEVILQELKKCQLLCKKCHYKKSKKEGSLKNQVGEHNTQAKLSEDIVKDILIRTESNGKIAKIYDVSRTTIWMIKHKILWKHIK
jgi:5-methylcytosine-specific restriction endonuclease McrA